MLKTTSYKLDLFGVLHLKTLGEFNNENNHATKHCFGHVGGITVRQCVCMWAVKKLNILVIWGEDIGWSNIGIYNHAIIV